MVQVRARLGRRVALVGAVCAVAVPMWAVPAAAVTPVISSFSPPSGVPGTSVTISGSGLSTTSQVKFNGTLASSLTLVSDTQIRATVPSAATTGPISVTTTGGTVTSGANFLVTPVITSFTPASGPVGTSITINGTGFTGTTSVSLNNAAIAYTVVSNIKITAIVGTANTSGKIAVTTAGGTATSTASFTVVPAVAVTPVRAWARPGATISAAITTFAPLEAVDVYWDTTDMALTVTNGAGSAAVSITIPPTSVPGQHWVTAIGRRSGAAAQKGFNVWTDWPQQGMTPNREDTNHFENVINAANANTVDFDWFASLASPVVGTPVVVGNFVYAATANGVVVKINGDSGQIVATRNVGSALEGTPAVDVVSGVLVVGDSAGDIVGLKTLDLTPAWTAVHTGNKIGAAAPAVQNGVFYVTSYDGKLRAIRAASGAVDWTYTAIGSIHSGVAISTSGRIFVRSCDTGSGKEWMSTLSLTGQDRPGYSPDYVGTPCSDIPLTVLWGQPYWQATADFGNGPTCFIFTSHVGMRDIGNGADCEDYGAGLQAFALFDHARDVAIFNTNNNASNIEVGDGHYFFTKLPNTVYLSYVIDAPVIANNLLYAGSTVSSETNLISHYDNEFSSNRAVVVNGRVYSVATNDAGPGIARFSPSNPPPTPPRPRPAQLRRNPNLRVAA